MISIVLYGRNDSYGYNLHKRAALAINCMAEVLSDPSDEIVFVDYNTPDDYPTFPEAIGDTLTEAAVSRLRVLRVRPTVHDRVRSLTHLVAIEPIARNVGIRRSNPANRWILSTNTDMIFVPRGQASLSDIARRLPDGYYHLPRFELPESLWEGFDRRDPRTVIEQVRGYGCTMFLNEIVYGAESIKYDAPGDFQLILREDLFRLDGFDESMLLGWHVDSNIAKRLFLRYGRVGDAVDQLFGYHCDHTRQVTPAHKHQAPSNDMTAFIDNVRAPGVPLQRHSWGCQNDVIEEVHLRRSSHHVFVQGISRVLRGQWSEPVEARYTLDSWDRHSYDARHVLPFLADLFTSAPRTMTVGWFGGREDLFGMFCGLWESFGFEGNILVEPWTVPLLAKQSRPGVRVEALPEIMKAAQGWIFDFGAPSHSGAPVRSIGAEAVWVDQAVDHLITRAFVEVTAGESAQVAAGQAPRRIICVNAVHNRYESLVAQQINAASTPFATRLRHGFAVSQPTGLTSSSKEREALLAGVPGHRYDVLERLGVAPGGRSTRSGVLAPLGRRGYVVRGRPYEQLLPGPYQVEVTIGAGRVGVAATARPVILEVVGSQGLLLAREQFSVRAPGKLSLTFTVPAAHKYEESGVEIRLFRGRFSSFVITAVHLWRLPPLGMPPMRSFPSAAAKLLADAISHHPLRGRKAT